MSAAALDRLEARIEAVDSMLCVGLDSACRAPPARFAPEPDPQLAFNRWVIDQTHAVRRRLQAQHGLL